MTNEKLAQVLGTARRMVELDMGGEFDGAIVLLADQRDVAIDQRDRALALLRDERVGTSCGYEDPAKCPGDWSGEGETKIADVCWEHRCRALQDEVEG